MIILGISAYYHDSAAALVKDGSIVAAAQQERFSRIKGDARFPGMAISYCLERANLRLVDVDWVVFYDKPLLTFDRLLETYLDFAPRGFGSFLRSMPVWLKEKLLLPRELTKSINRLGLGRLDESRLLFAHHHHSHAASAFYPSPFARAAVLVMDGVGEWATLSYGRGDGNDLELMREIRFPHSLGLLYSAFTHYLGFRVNDGEYKVMGLAPYGKPRYANLIKQNLIHIQDDGSFRLNMEYFEYCYTLRMTGKRFTSLFGGHPVREHTAPLEEHHMDMAASVQCVLEEIVLKLANTVYRETGENNLCLAGGVALNCVANTRLMKEGPFDNLWIQPAAGDAGGALGAALAVYHQEFCDQSVTEGSLPADRMRGAFLGPEYDDVAIDKAIATLGLHAHLAVEENLYSCTAGYLAEGRVVGWFQGRMEYGPRALGARSILADPRPRAMQQRLNIKIKYRESFRPFAPAILKDRCEDYFELETSSPYMLLVNHLKAEYRYSPPDIPQGLDKLAVAWSDFPAVTHVDYSARVQTVDKESNPRFHRLLVAFEELTGCPMLVNTSFNVRDEPIVCTPEDGLRCFLATEMDVLIMGHHILLKEEQNP